ncbi:MAG: ABC transporter permease [Thermoflexales bacterium]|nr:ABC transporter permease [Thermoflexales bacterium]MDW8352351.1 ABC transporter permease [Anaerolineae bacterium]
MQLSIPAQQTSGQPNRWILILRYMRRNKSLVVGLAMLAFLLIFSIGGSLLIDTSTRAYPLAAPAVQPPSPEYPLGTDRDGRDLLAVMARGILLTGSIGVMAGTIGLVVGVIVGFVAGYYGGWIDSVIRWLTEVLMTIPALILQIIIASTIVDKNKVTIFTMAGVASILSWMGTARIVRSQVLTLRERTFVNMAKLSGMGNLEIIFRELMPNMLPYLAASFVGAVMGGIGSSFGLEILGLGPAREPTIGMTIRWAQFHSAIFNRWWWWVLWPSLVLIIIFASLSLINRGLDEIANPRVRRSE